MNILIANIGNIRVNEIKALAEVLNKKHKVTIASMNSDARHRGNAFTPFDTPVAVMPLSYKDVMKSASWVSAKSPSDIKDYNGIAVYEFDARANPADAMSIMLCEVMAHKPPDIVVCGINNDVHLGQDIYCSSNIGMAMEACFLGHKVIAVGVQRKVGGHTEAELAPAAEFIEKNIEKFAKMKLPEHTFLTINIPNVEKYKDFKGIKIKSMEFVPIAAKYLEKTDAYGQKYFWADLIERNDEDLTDGYITIVPINYNATDHETIEKWGTLVNELKDVADSENEDDASEEEVEE
jgi:5'-nucleotidase